MNRKKPYRVYVSNIFAKIMQHYQNWPKHLLKIGQGLNLGIHSRQIPKNLGPELGAAFLYTIYSVSGNIQKRVGNPKPWPISHHYNVFLISDFISYLSTLSSLQIRYSRIRARAKAKYNNNMHKSDIRNIQFIFSQFQITHT